MTSLPAVTTTISGTFTISSLHFATLAAMLCTASPPLLGTPQSRVYAETLLCDAFGIKYKRSSTAFIEFCGFNPRDLFNLSMYETSGSQLAATRVFNHHKRATDLDGAGRSTATSRLAAKRHNADARKHNACADSPDYKIIPIHDGRNLVVPGFPTDYEWFLKPHRRDVLYLLGEYGQDIEPEGCLERFEAFARVPEPKGRQKGVEWLL